MPYEDRMWGKAVLNTTKTECGHLTTHMSRIKEERVEDLSDSLKCEKCFDVDPQEEFDPDEELDTSGTPIQDPEHPVNQPKPAYRPPSK